MLAHNARQSTSTLRELLGRIPLECNARQHLRRLPDGRVLADWFGCALSSVFQPIVRAGDGQVVAHEAFLRSVAGGEPQLSPWTLFSAAANDDHLLALDWLCRTIHSLNAIAAGDDSLLFLNVHGRLMSLVDKDHGQAFRKLVEALGVPPERIVVETPLEASLQPDLLAFVMRNYTANGFQVAVNVESVAQWQSISSTAWAPFVKLDGRKLLASGAVEPGNWIEALREETTIVVTHLEAPFPAGDSSGIWLQGNAYGKPVPRLSRLVVDAVIAD